MLATRSVASNPIVRYVADALRFYMEFHSRYDGFYGAFIHDPLAVAAALDPTLDPDGGAAGRRRARRDADDRRDRDRLATRLEDGPRTSTSPWRPTPRRSSTVSWSASDGWRPSCRQCTLRAEGSHRAVGPEAAGTNVEGWMNGQFSTRVITLMPVAIAINIVLGVTVQQVLKLPIYLDSIGTILVGVLAGPLAGALTGILTNLIWQYAPGIGGGTIGPFAITAGRDRRARRPVGPARRLQVAPSRAATS